VKTRTFVAVLWVVTVVVAGQAANALGQSLEGGAPLGLSSPGDIWVLDINRGSDGRIVQVDGEGDVIGTVPAHPDVEPLRDATGIEVDSEGFLVVASRDGYGGNAFGSCLNGCGAVLRIDPRDGATQVLSRGQSFENPTAVLLPQDRDIVDGVNDFILVTDNGGPNRIFRIAVDVADPAQALDNQTNFSSPNGVPDSPLIVTSKTHLGQPMPMFASLAEKLTSRSLARPPTATPHCAWPGNAPPISSSWTSRCRAWTASPRPSASSSRGSRP